MKQSIRVTGRVTSRTKAGGKGWSQVVECSLAFYRVGNVKPVHF